MSDWLSISLGFLSIILGGLALFITVRLTNVGKRSEYFRIYNKFVNSIRFKMFALEFIHKGTSEEKKKKEEIFEEAMEIPNMIRSIQGNFELPDGYKNNKKFIELVVDDSTTVADFIKFFDEFLIKLYKRNNMIIKSKYNDLNEYDIKYKRNWYCIIMGFTEELKSKK